mgnify:FL=1
MKNIEESRFGINLFHQKFLIYHNFKCNGCRKNPKTNYEKTSRWICLSCQVSVSEATTNQKGYDFVDFCGACMNVIKKRDEPNNSDFNRLNAYVKENTPNHDMNNHVYLRVPFAGKDYFTY